MKEIHLDKKRKLNLEYNTLSEQFVSLKKKISAVQNKINEIKNKEEEQGLLISAHAYDRYKERILNTRNRYIKKHLLTKDLINLVKNKDGNFSHPNIKHLTVVVKDNTIVTLYKSFDVEKEFNYLTMYMNHFINLTAQGIKPCTFEEFKQFNYLK